MTIYHTQNLQLPYPDGNEAIELGPQDFQNIVQILDAGGSGPTAARVTSGVISGLPAASSVPLGSVYLCTDVSAAFIRDSASNWRPFSVDSNSAPIGSSMEYWASTDPVDPDGVTRWMIMNGRTLSRTTYSKLFSRFGTTYGAGDGVTTFGIPNTANLFTLGAGSNALGSTGGSSTAALTGANVPQHTHGYSGSGGTGWENQAHNHDIDPSGNGFAFYVGGYQAGDFGFANGTGSGWQLATVTNTENQSHNHNFSWSGETDTGAGLQPTGQAFSTVPPWIAANRILRVL